MEFISIFAHLTFVVLVVGLIKPNWVLFGTVKKDRVIVLKYYGSIFLLITIVLGLSVNRGNVKNQKQAGISSEVKQTTNERKSGELEREQLAVRIEDSELYFPVEIVEIKVLKEKDYFSVEVEKYADPKKEDGYILEVYFAIKNPSEKNYTVPFNLFPQLFASSGSLQRIHGRSYDRKKQEYYLYGKTQQTDGSRIDFVRSKERHDLLRYEGNEAKSMKIVFPAITEDIRTVYVTGFNYENNNMVKTKLPIDIVKGEIIQN
jgi:hypothetical protein